MDVARDMMALAARTSDAAFEENAPQFSSIPSVPFRLPDGTEVRYDMLFCVIMDLMLGIDPIRSDPTQVCLT